MSLTDEAFKASLAEVTSAVTKGQDELMFLSMISNIPIFDAKGRSPADLEDFLTAIRSALPFKNKRDEYCIRAASLRSGKLVQDVVANFTLSEEPQTWNNLEAELRKYFGYPEDTATLRQTLKEVKQKPMETIHHFSKRLEIQAQKAYPAPLKLSDTLVQESLVFTFINGLKDKYTKRKMIALNPSTLADAVDKASKEETTQRRFQAFGEKMLPPVDPTREEIPMDCSAMTYTNEAYNEDMYQTAQQDPVETVPQTFAQPQIVYVQQEQPMPQYVPHYQAQETISMPQYVQHYQAQEAVPMLHHVQQEHITYGDDGMNEYANYANEGTQDQMHEDLVEDIQCCAIQQTGYQRQPRKCWSCGSQYHIQRDCPKLRQYHMTQQRFSRPYQAGYPPPPMRYQQRPQAVYRPQSFVRPQQPQQTVYRPQQPVVRPQQFQPQQRSQQSFRQQQPAQSFRQLGATKKSNMSHF